LGLENEIKVSKYEKQLWVEKGGLPSPSPSLSLSFSRLRISLNDNGVRGTVK